MSELTRIMVGTCRNHEFEGCVLLNNILDVLILVNGCANKYGCTTREAVANASIISNPTNMSLASKEVPINPPRNLCLRIKELTRK